MTRWTLDYDQWIPHEEKLRESLCTLGNGYFAVRGASEESGQSHGHYHGMYLSGGYNRVESFISGKLIEHEDLVNWPDVTGLSFRVRDGKWFTLQFAQILSFHQGLDIKKGVLKRSIQFILDGQQSLLETTRFVSMDNPHLMCIQWELTPVNWEGLVEVRTSLDGSVTNGGVDRYKDLNNKHLYIEDKGLAFEDSIYLVARTIQSSIQMAITAKTIILVDNIPWPVSRETMVQNERIDQILSFSCRQNKKIQIEKMISIYTSRDSAISLPVLSSKKLIMRLNGFEDHLKRHEKKWSILWRRFNISLDGLDEETKIIRLHIFHLLQTACHNSVGLDVSIPARGLHGEAYRGHIFWDELFIFPLFYFRMPRLARSLLMYRYRRLDEARYLARDEGHKGAMFPWQSGSDGREEGQHLHLNPESGHWIPDYTHKQRHINGAVAYNVVNYLKSTQDREFLANYGIDILLETARFWISLLEYDHTKLRYEILGVVGPDEFHTKYPDGENPGINNNAYTNFIASWTIKNSVELLKTLDNSKKDEVLERLEISPSEISQWMDKSQKIYIPFIEEGLIAQFEGYEKLKDFNWKDYNLKYKRLQRLDRILEKEGDDINRYKVNKQADVLMLFYLFSSKELNDHFAWMNYQFESQFIQKNINYYLKETTSGSSLSRIVHSWVMARLDRKHAWSLFKEALMSDVIDIQGGTTSEGIHLGAMAGTVDIIQRCFTGLEIKEDILWFSPRLPEELTGIKFSICYRSHWLEINLNHSSLHIHIEHSWGPGGKLGFMDKVYDFKEGSVFHFSLLTWNRGG
jgi:trehalose/maltose hydrolase-like predicted phosphorylase